MEESVLIKNKCDSVIRLLGGEVGSRAALGDLIGAQELLGHIATVQTLKTEFVDWEGRWDRLVASLGTTFPNLATMRLQIVPEEIETPPAPPRIHFPTTLPIIPRASELPSVPPTPTLHVEMPGVKPEPKHNHDFIMRGEVCQYYQQLLLRLYELGGTASTIDIWPMGHPKRSSMAGYGAELAARDYIAREPHGNRSTWVLTSKGEDVVESHLLNTEIIVTEIPQSDVPVVSTDTITEQLFIVDQPVDVSSSIKAIDTSQELIDEAKKYLAGKRCCLVGGNRRSEVVTRIQKAFGMKSLEWPTVLPNTSRSKTISLINQSKPEIIFALIRWIQHGSYDSIKDWCTENNIPLITVPKGYNPSELARDVLNTGTITGK